MGNFTYPTRNFATLGPFVLLHQQANCPVCGDTPCTHLLHVAMQIGLSHPFEQRARRIVSEESGESRSFLLIVRTSRFVTATRVASTGGSNGVSSI
jgi:hypothetical protein